MTYQESLLWLNYDRWCIGQSHVVMSGVVIRNLRKESLKHHDSKPNLECVPVELSDV